jgi:hypothetical protein
MVAAIGVERPVDPGKVSVQVKAPGFKPRAEALELAEAEHKAIDVTLEAEVSPSPVGGAPVLVPTVATTPLASADGGDLKSSRSMLGPALLIGGGVALLSGMGLGAWGYSKATDSPTRDGSQADSARRLALVGDISMVAGIVASSAGLWMVLSPSKPARNTATTISPWMSPSAIGVAGRGSF